MIPEEPIAGEADLAALDDLPDPKPTGLTDADFHGCRFVAGEPTPLRRGMFCGVKTLPGESWCFAHHAICYRRAPAKSAA